MPDFNIYAQLRLFLSLFFLTLQFITLPHFILRQEYRSATSFRIMFAIGLCECYQMVVMGICPFFKFIHFYGPFVENITGALNESTLDTLFLLNLLLAINRLIVMVKMNVLHQFGEGESGREKVMYMSLYIISGLTFLLITALFMSSFCGLYLDEEYTIWNYNMNLSWTASVRQIELYGYMGFPTICFLIYCSIVLMMKCNASKLLSNNQSIAMQRSREFRILLQSLIQFLVFIIPIVYGISGWRVGNTALDNYGVSSVCTIIYTGINPILYLLLLPKLRAQVISSLTFGIDFFEFNGNKKMPPPTVGNTVNVQPARSIIQKRIIAA